MGDGSLSQEEIDALLMGADDMGGGGSDAFAAPAASTPGAAAGLSSNENELLTESINEAMVTAGNQASALLDGKTTALKVTSIEEIDAGAISSDTAIGSAVVGMGMGPYANLFVFPEDLAGRIAMTMMGMDGQPDSLDEAHLSTLSELLNTIVSSLSNGLGTKFNDTLTPGAPDAKIFSSGADLTGAPTGKTAKITYSLNIDGLQGGKFTQYVDAKAPKKWAGTLSGARATESAGGSGGGEMDLGGEGNIMGGGVPMNPVNFPSLQSSSSGMNQQLPPNFDLLLDVQMVMTVELGRTRKYVKDILGLGEGSIIELDKLAGEPVDLLVNGKLIAKGEVVVIDENFGVRVTDIVGPSERIARMGGN